MALPLPRDLGALGVLLLPSPRKAQRSPSVLTYLGHPGPWKLLPWRPLRRHPFLGVSLTVGSPEGPTASGTLGGSSKGAPLVWSGHPQSSVGTRGEHSYAHLPPLLYSDPPQLSLK